MDVLIELVGTVIAMVLLVGTVVGCAAPTVIEGAEEADPENGDVDLIA